MYVVCDVVCGTLRCSCQLVLLFCMESVEQFHLATALGYSRGINVISYLLLSIPCQILNVIANYSLPCQCTQESVLEDDAACLQEGFRPM